MTAVRIKEETRRDFWDQIKVTKKTAEMSLDIFDQLPEYSSTVPTGTRIGKRWKRRERGGNWLMGEYFDALHAGKRWVWIKWRDIRITDDLR